MGQYFVSPMGQFFMSLDIRYPTFAALSGRKRLTIGPCLNIVEDILSWGSCARIPFVASGVAINPIAHEELEKMAEMENRWLSVDEIGKYLGVSSDTVYRWIGKRGMPAHRMGRLWKFKQDEVDEWVKAGGSADTP